jgi:hypothetical protein
MKLLLKHRYLLQRADRTKLRSTYSFEYAKFIKSVQSFFEPFGEVVESFAIKSEGFKSV